MNKPSGVQGWQQFLTARNSLLEAYDRARTKSKARPLQTEHGRVAEATFRQWLESFLPQRFGVTSGYVVSQGLTDEHKLPEFDVIIYDKLEAPILWLDGNPDHSGQGERRAVPAEHVRAVIEVKSSLDRDSARSAIEHLLELAPLLMTDGREIESRYQKSLPPTFFGSVAFFELRAENANDREAVNSLIPKSPFPIGPGVILRGPITPYASCKIEYTWSPEPIAHDGQRSIADGLYTSDSRRIDDHKFINAILLWNRIGFSMYAFDILALLRGTYKPGFVSSFHGVGWDG